MRKVSCISFLAVTKSNKKRYKAIVDKSYIVAYVFRPPSYVDYSDPGDYHWYRLDKGGRWSHKPGWKKVQRTDKSGKAFPTSQYAKHGYSEFIGYYYVKK
jgi:hypothetical protein